MKVAERVLDVDSTLTGEKGRFQIDEDSIQHIIGVLTDLYSDPELAVIREYSTNALDAHREAGNSAPIEVTTPTNLAPFFRVKDHGIGLDAEGLRSIYSRYGSSTKRDSDEQVGMLGLGSKSALTYSDQFTLIGTKGGRQVQVQIGRDEDGGVSYTIVSDEPTDQPNGVEVIVPAKRDNAFEAKAKRFFRFWKPEDVLLNGSAPQTIAEQADPIWLIEDELFVFDPRNLDDGTIYSRYRDAYSPGWVVMGGVAYPMPEESGMRNRTYRVVAFVDIGDVNFTPSREALMLTKRTKETLARIDADVARELANAAQKRVAESDSPAEAIRRVQEAAAMGVKTDGIKYQGREVPVKLERQQVGYGFHTSDSYLVYSPNQYRARKAGERYHSITPYATNRLVFTGYESKELTPTRREKLEVWIWNQDFDTRPQQLVFVDKLNADERFWLTGTPIYDWAPVQEIKLEKEKSGTVGPDWRQRPRGSYEQAYYHGGGHIEADHIDTSKPILWTTTDERCLNLTDHGVPSDAAVIVLPANRREKFLRDFPTALEWRDYIRKEAKEWLAKQDPARVEIAKYHISGVGDRLSGLDPERVSDPELAAAIRKQQAKVGDLVKGIQQRQRWLGDDFERYTLTSKYENPLKKYPLLLGRNNLNHDHVYLYINAAYAA